MKGKVVIIILMTGFLVGLVGVVTALGLAIIGPLHPGQDLFVVQNWAEHRFLLVLPSSMGKAQFEMQVLDRRIRDLTQLMGGSYEGKAFVAVSDEILHVIDSYKSLPEKDQTGFRNIFSKELETLLTALAHNKESSRLQPATFEAFMAKLQDLKAAIENQNLSPGDLTFSGALKEIPNFTSRGSSMSIILSAMESQIVPFPSGSAGAKHQFYPLDGEHSEITCLSCHNQGNYKGTPGLCTNCHLEVKPERHFSGQCQFCHTTTAWLPSVFDHQVGVSVDCQTCHLSEMPANHFQGQCSACHTTTAWLPATFDHQTIGTSFCQNCHIGNKPANHYTGECSACHSTASWLPANFDHLAAGAVDCSSCHIGAKPANHYSGQCSACHSTTAWLPASFNHQAAGATDCQACHANVLPANHFSGQCSTCHSTSEWKPASFSHTFPTDHGGANGVCAECHTSGDANWTCFSCHNEYEMTKKHNEEGIADYVIRCLECHGDGRKHDD